MRSNLSLLTLCSCVLQTALIPLILSSIPLPYSLRGVLPAAEAAGWLDQCGFAYAGLFTDHRVSSCMPFEALNKLFGDDSNVTSQLVNDTATLFCTMPFCSASAVALIDKTLSQNCAESPDDIESLQWLYRFASLYVPFKQGICQRFEPATNGTFCITIFAEAMNTYADQHPDRLDWKIFENSTEMDRYVDQMPSSMLCTPCNKLMISPMIQFVIVQQLALPTDNVAWVRGVQSGIEKRCGAGFVDGIGPPPPVDQTSDASSLVFSPSSCSSSQECYRALTVASVVALWASLAR
ncbi:hypothetical protein BGZ70_004955 [Mortierella alpina]|uniref:Uncharacterized protein n=1 Tax=Mortierella alpina TaxID=64518 RepID=A0A9P6M711_MORAP|nr:hypothetical protein BGZ70_004955 [Mortierella alpina]